jgi:hypothetical protein
VYDPSRDDPILNRRYYRRLAIVTVVGILAAAALLPSVLGFAGGVDSNRGCVAILDGWHADRSIGDADIARAITLTDQIRAERAIEWRAGPGACVPEARHRLIVSGFLLVVLGAGGVAVAVVARASRRRDGTVPPVTPLEFVAANRQ